MSLMGVLSQYVLLQVVLKQQDSAHVTGYFVVFLFKSRLGCWNGGGRRCFMGLHVLSEAFQSQLFLLRFINKNIKSLN